MAEPDRIEWSFGRAALDALDDRWNAVAGRHPTPFALREWLEPWWHAFGHEMEPAVCRAWRGGELVGGVAMTRTRSGLVAMANVQTPVLAVLHVDDAALHAVATSVAASSAGVVSLGPLSLHGPETAAFREATRAVGGIARVDPARVSPIVDTIGDFEAYRASMKDGWKELERRGRKAAREHELVVRAIETPRGDLSFLEEGLSVEASGWKGQEGTAILFRPDTATFYRELAPRFAERGELALSGLWLDDRLVAFDLSLVYGNRYWLLKTGYLEGFRNLGPGLILRRAVVERCFEMGLLAHEFLGSDKPWKRIFATSDRAHCTWSRYRRRPGPLSRLAWKRLRPQVRGAYRTLRPK